MVVGFLFYWGLMLFRVKGVGFDNTWLTNGQQMSQGLFQDFMDGYLKPEDSLHYWLNIVL